MIYRLICFTVFIGISALVASSATAVEPIAPNDLLLTVTTDHYTISDVETQESTWRTVRAHGPGRIAEPGRPELPALIRWIGVPDGYTVRVTIESEIHTDIPGYPIAPASRDTIVQPGPYAASVPTLDEGFYRSSSWYPERIAEVGKPGRLRHQRIVPIHIHPYRTLPSSGLLRVHDELVLRVRFVPDPVMKGGLPKMERTGEDPLWENMYGSMLANYSEARSYRTRKTRSFSSSTGKNRNSGDEYKLYVRESGLYRIDFSELNSVGFPSGEELSSLCLARRGFSDKEFDNGADPFTETILPLHVEDTDGDSLFGNGDYLLAWLPGFREDRMIRDYEDRYATEAVYFLTTGGGGKSFERSNAWRGYNGLDPLVSFPDSVRWESDIFYAIDPVSDTTDLYFPWNKTIGPKTMDIDLPPPDTTELFGLKVMTVSTVHKWGPTYHRYTVLDESESDTLFNELVSVEQPRLFPAEKTFPGSRLQQGINSFRYKGFRGSTSDTPYTGVGGYFDWFEIHASFLYKTQTDYIRFSTGEAKDRVQIEPCGFSDSLIFLFDVTDPYNPVWVETDSVTQCADGYALVLQDSVGSACPYAAATPDGALRLSDGKIVHDNAAGLAGSEANYLIVTHDDFRDPLDDLADHREADGFSVQIARIDDIYDEFNGGVKDPVAIHRYFHYAFDHWTTPPAYALLVGDAYEDVKGAAENYINNNAYDNEYDYIPAHLTFQPEHDDEGDLWSASDLWFVLFDDSHDYMPDMLIGRLPVKTADEAATIVDKTIAYETEGLDDSWRRRAGFIADDEWTFFSGPIRNSYQDQFEEGCSEFAARITDDAQIRADTVLLRLFPYTDVYHELCPYPLAPTNPDQADLDCVIGHTRGDTAVTGGVGESVTDAFFDMVNERGVYLLNYQGHASRSSLSHELFLVDGTSYRNWVSFDLDRSSPGSAPYIFLGFGCSASEFDVFRSLGQEALPERMVRLPETGAVLAFGSTKLELLHANLDLNESILSYLHPARSAKDKPSIIRRVGDCLVSGLIDYASYYGRDDLIPWVIFGDPALRLDPPPSTLTVTADGDTVTDGGTHLARADGAPVQFAVHFDSDVYLADEGIDIFENGQPIPDSLFTIEEGTDSTDGRWRWTILYDRKIETDLEEILFRASDLWGNRATSTVYTSIDIDLTFDGAVWVEEIVVPPVTRLAIEIESDLHLEKDDIRIETSNGASPPDTLYRNGDQWVAEALLVLQVGEETLSLFIDGWKQEVVLHVVKSVLEITAEVDGVEASNGSSLLGHLDGTPPVIKAFVNQPPDLPNPEIRIVEEGDTLQTDDYSVTEDTIDGRPFLVLVYEPDLRNDKYEIRIDVSADGEPGAAFIFRVGMPITLTLDGLSILDGDFVSASPEARAALVFPDSIPDEEAVFELDGLPVDPDTLRREGEDRWIATVSLDAGGGSHTIAFQAGAFISERTVRVDHTLRIEEPLCHPNPGLGVRGFYYRLSTPADHVRIEIYTVTGRRIRVLNGLSGNVGYNANKDVWDSRDADGDTLARGVYPFRVIAVRGGEKAEAIGKIIVGDKRTGG